MISNMMHISNTFITLQIGGVSSGFKSKANALAFAARTEFTENIRTAVFAAWSWNFGLQCWPLFIGEYITDI